MDEQCRNNSGFMDLKMIGRKFERYFNCVGKDTTDKYWI